MSALFISHSSVDNEAARRTVEQLQRNGYRSIFVDFDREAGILPGDGWEDVLYRRIRSCQALIALVSRDSLASTWCETEIRLAKALRKRIFPMRLDDSDISRFDALQFGDLRGVGNEGFDVAGRFAPLVAALEKAKVSTGVWDEKRSPYPGLVAFEEEDAGVFFGREREITHVIASLERMRERPSPRWLAMIGASGSGKSSLVRAGVIPKLRAEGHKHWIAISAFRCGIDPFESAALALSAAFARLGSERDATQLRDALVRDESESLSNLASELRLAAKAPEAAVLIVVDQLEELLAGPSRESTVNDGSARFLKALRHLTELEGAPFYVLATLRADFLGPFQTCRALQGLDSTELVVKPLELSKLSRVIEEPAMLASVAFEDGLVDRIVRDTIAEDALPLLAFTLRELYDRHSAESFIESRHYDALGGLQAAVAKRADDVLENVHDDPSPEAEAELRAAFLSLVQPNDDRQVARRRVLWRELPESVHPKLQSFVKARLLVSADGDDGDPSVEVAHEALFRSWTKLAGWIARSKEFLAWRKRFDPSVERWVRAGRAASQLIQRPDLGEAEAWLAKEGRLLSNRERDYIEASLSAERRRKWRTRITVGGVLVTLVALAGMAFLQRQKADREAAKARRNEMEARNVALVGAAAVAVDTATKVAILREVRLPPPGAWLAAAASRSRIPVPELVVEGHGGRITAMAIGSNGRVATASSDRTVRVWNTSGTGQPVDLKGHTEEVTSVAFSPDGSKVLTGSADHTARVWNADGMGQPVELKGHGAKITSVAFSSNPNDRRVLTGSEDGTARVWEASGANSVEIQEGIGPIRTVEFSPDGTKVLLTGWNAPVAHIWNADGRGEPIALEGHEGPILLGRFSPDGKRVVTTSVDKTARVWNADGAGRPVVLAGHSNWIRAAAFSPDNRMIVTGSDDQTARVWRSDGGGRPVELTGHINAVRAVAFSPDNKRVVTGSKDANAVVWNADGAGQPMELAGHNASVTAVGFSPDGAKVITSSDDGTARVWNSAGAGEPLELTGFSNPPHSVAFSADGKAVLMATSDRARVWKLDGPGQAIEPGRRPGSFSPVALSPDGRKVLVGSTDDEMVRVWSSDGTGQAVELRAGRGVDSATFSGDGRKVLTVSGETARIWNVDGSGEAVELGAEPERIAQVAFSSDGRRVVTRSREGTTRVWRVDEPTKPVTLSVPSGTVRSIALSPDADARKVLTGLRDGKVLVWNADGVGQPVELTGHTGDVTAAAFSADGSRIVTGSADKTVRVWAANNASPSFELKGHTGSVASVAFSRDGTKILTVANDKTARLWNADGVGEPVVFVGEGTFKTETLGTLTAHVAGAFSPDGKSVVTALGDTTVRVWRVDARDLRMLLWRQTRVCLQPLQRTALLGETAETARDGSRRCLDTVERCRAGVEACESAIAKAYDEQVLH